jgi:hypothetical protein
MRSGGGGDVTLSKAFVAGAYPGQIRIPRGGTCVFRGKGQVLDARNAGRLFSVSGTGSSLEIHGLVLKNGGKFGRGLVSPSFQFCFGSIRSFQFCFKKINDIFALCPAAPHATIFERPPLRQFCSGRHETMRSRYVWLLAFVCTTFRPYPSIILEKQLTEIFALCSGAPHATFRKEEPSTFRMELLLSMTRLSIPTALIT